MSLSANVSKPEAPFHTNAIDYREAQIYFSARAQICIQQQSLVSEQVLGQNSDPLKGVNHIVLTTTEHGANPTIENSNITLQSRRSPHLPANKNAALLAAKIAADCPDTGLNVKNRFKCTIPNCEKSFLRRYNLNVHARVHTKETPYTCKEMGCGKNFKWRSSIAHHQLCHEKKTAEIGKTGSNGQALASCIPHPQHIQPEESDALHGTGSAKAVSPLTISIIRQDLPQGESSPDHHLSSENAIALGDGTSTRAETGPSEMNNQGAHERPQEMEIQREDDFDHFTRVDPVHLEEDMVEYYTVLQAYKELMESDSGAYGTFQ